MTIHVNMGEAKTRLSQLVAAAMRGEEVIVQKAGAPQVKLVPVEEAEAEKRREIARRRIANIGRFREAFEGYDVEIEPSMTDEEVEERYRRKFGPAD